MPLDDKDIIQIDATVIASALVLLTLSFTLGTLKASETAQQAMRITLALMVTVPFSISAMFVISENVTTNEKHKGKFRRYALGGMFVGFGLIICFFAILMSFYVCTQCWK